MKQKFLVDFYGPVGDFLDDPEGGLLDDRCFDSLKNFFELQTVNFMLVHKSFN